MSDPNDRAEVADICLTALDYLIDLTANDAIGSAREAVARVQENALAEHRVAVNAFLLGLHAAVLAIAREPGVKRETLLELYRRMALDLRAQRRKASERA